MKAKYIIVNYKEMEIPIVFSPFLQHRDIGYAHNVISAGFCSKASDSWKCWGESITLKIGSRPEDPEILNKMLEYSV